VHFLGTGIADHLHDLQRRRAAHDRIVDEHDALAFLSINGLYRAVGGEDRNPARPQFTDHYFTGDYPTRLLDKEGETMGRKVSLLATNG
jgi:glutamine phosphoribosylpyrophosphate amidotransferase